ncbi:MAG: dissimilatory sulfite reductase D family protein [Proteobacteria bacterium]|nr:dissimilatory sulfite reductase D family protein [Pseudomonadota bacterium]
MATDEQKKLIVEALEKKTGKSKFYLKDFYTMIPDLKPRAIKNIVNEMVADGILEYWSSGSTTLIGLKGVGKQAGAEHED